MWRPARRTLKKTRTANLAGVRRGLCREPGICCSEVPTRGAYPSTAHAQLVTGAVRAPTHVRRVRWAALVCLLAGALGPDVGRLAPAEPADPAVYDLQLRPVRSAVPSRHDTQRVRSSVGFDMTRLPTWPMLN